MLSETTDVLFSFFESESSYSYNKRQNQTFFQFTSILNIAKQYYILKSGTFLCRAYFMSDMDENLNIE